MDLSIPMTSPHPLVVGAGSALVDILLRESEEFLAASGARKGGMTLVEHTVIDGILENTAQEPLHVSGGSACNTIVGIGKLGGRARFVGTCGTDKLGKLFESGLKLCNVEPLLTTCPSPTGQVLSIITPDAQRSMFTYLGASSEMKPENITASCFEGATLVHVEGYLLFNEELIRATLAAARKAGALVSLDMASYTVVEASRKALGELLPKYVDIILANEDEARVYTGESDEEKALGKLAKESTIAVVKLGKRGSMIYHDGETVQLGIRGDGSAVDTTGAGDLWASGFLYGIVHGYTLEQAANLAAACGYEVCQVIGAQIPDEGWQRIHGEFPSAHGS